jgi:hypothetical protein
MHMSLRGRIVICGCLNLLLLLTVIAHAIPAAGNQGVKGSYWVIGTTNLGAEVRVNLHVRLFNTGEDRLFITEMALADPLRRVRGSESRSLILEPHDTSSFTQEFTISLREYGLWQNGHRPQLSLKIQAAGGERTLMVVLVRRPG